jgi:hypothetical protein
MAALKVTILQRVVRKNQKPASERLAGSKSEGRYSPHPSPEVQPPQAPRLCKSLSPKYRDSQEFRARRVSGAAHKNAPTGEVEAGGTPYLLERYTSIKIVRFPTLLHYRRSRSVLSKTHPAVRESKRATVVSVERGCRNSLGQCLAIPAAPYL